MPPPEPTLTFTIPSLHDDRTPLNCRIYHPPVGVAARWTRTRSARCETSSQSRAQSHSRLDEKCTREEEEEEGSCEVSPSFSPPPRLDESRPFDESSPQWTTPSRGGGAIVAHPYTPLGGSYDDAVVLAAVAEILKAGFVVGTFNFRYVCSWKSMYGLYVCTCVCMCAFVIYLILFDFFLIFGVLEFLILVCMGD